ncbi:NADPH-dependent ferric siderophore reductase, contains FAD-binding and SIP domains [Aliiroseovarius halocynthiae]|uniref:Siderophore-interacting protein n=1 Tax=Aliiroseovarius halocynthiae TaxID=985055 RepID=A0A545SLC3_9RHOB|nr:siderophore-interacting protein [Aliiroseovarius halocynthiae]TQV65775.1 siderophore-interacting protein [Aliiroseovarius halocynthiae]SMR83542.1 NADPH-dependent ferric siderophore reductase, contains FAD-binding and SIP domains [Aliiroseovarius halocynthiae]
MTDLIKVHADLAGLAFPAMRQMMLHEADEHDLPVLANHDDHLMVSSEYGAFGLTAQPDGIRLHVQAETDEHLYILRDSLIEHLIYFVPDLADSIRWSDGPAAETLPPNFQFAEILKRTELGTDFYRLVLRPERVQDFDDTAIHFRFVLPAPGDTSPEWPRVQKSGATKWPSGEKTLHRPVYTMRAFDQQAGTITADVFRHDGGRASDWAGTVKTGDSVAMIGPGGGGIVQTDEILICGDETAFPAIARIIDTLPATCTGAVRLLSTSGARDYPMPAHPGLALQWLSPEEDLADAAIAALDQLTSPFLWFSAESQPVAKLRKADAIARIDKSQRYVAAYWTKGT